MGHWWTSRPCEMRPANANAGDAEGGGWEGEQRLAREIELNFTSGVIQDETTMSLDTTRSCNTKLNIMSVSL
jgi:hypothetical protein